MSGGFLPDLQPYPPEIEDEEVCDECGGAEEVVWGEESYDCPTCCDPGEPDWDNEPGGYDYDR